MVFLIGDLFQFGTPNTSMTPPKQPADMGRKRDDSGQYVETVGPDDVLDVLARDFAARAEGKRRAEA